MIIHGDCLEYMKTLPDKSIDLILTDPPYGIDYQSSRRTDKDKRMPKIANDKEPFVKWTDNAFRVLKDDSPLICFTRWDTENAFREALTNSGFICKQQLIWDKVVHGMGDLAGDFAPQHENIIFAHKGRFVFKNERPTSVFRVMRVDPMNLCHPNEKPVKLIEQLVKVLTAPGDTVLDPFAGSGSTGVACKNLNRKYVLIEMDSNYIDVIKNNIIGELFKEEV